MLLREVADSISGAKPQKMSLGHLTRQEAKMFSKINVVMSKGQRSQFKRDSHRPKLR